jgi:hypothetical protein
MRQRLLQELCDGAPVAEIPIIVKCSKRTFCKLFPAGGSAPQPVDTKQGGRSIATKFELDELMIWIESCQVSRQCPRRAQRRAQMTKIIQRRDPELTAYGNWWKRFRATSGDVLAAAFLPSTEKARNELGPQLVCDHFVKLSALLPPFHM